MSQTPDETVIDPTYAAPEHYVMPTCTPTLPPDPLCSVISPIVWILNTPDRFDLYSAVSTKECCILFFLRLKVDFIGLFDYFLLNLVIAIMHVLSDIVFTICHVRC
jgi:hypothetical protein